MPPAAKRHENTPFPSPSFDHISDYEKWASSHWLHEPGSIEAQQHARAKLGEETQELIEAITSGTPDEVISEAGDVLWTAAATASNAGITITEVVESAFPGYLAPDTPINTQEIDRLAQMLFDDVHLMDLGDYLRESEHILGKTAEQWFNLNNTVSTPVKTFADAWINIKRADAASALLQLTLLVSYVAQHYAGQSLRSVLGANYQKIEQRLQAGDSVTKPPRRVIK